MDIYNPTPTMNNQTEDKIDHEVHNEMEILLQGHFGRI